MNPQTSSQDKHVLFEGLSFNLNPAPFWPRVAAYVIDMSVLTVIFYLLFIVYAIVGLSVFSLGSLTLSEITKSSTPFIILLVIVIVLGILFLFAVYHGYFVYQEYKYGTTLGKRILGLKVVSLSGQSLSKKQCFLRDMMRYIDAMLVLPGLISILVTKNKQRLGDLMCGTLVTYSKQAEKKQNSRYIQPEHYYLYLEALSPKEVPLGICQNYLSYTHPAFILKTKLLSDADIQTLFSQISPYLNNLDKHNADPKSILLFFAEYCLKTLNKEHTQGRSK